ncbi:unnamed protein product [Peniophora sp. CBMAI 1063]|nr:unnamed protein product [Peniophora sp. CBMAI 1063]
MSPFPLWSRLPVELVREILALAASDSPRAAAHLCLVSRIARHAVLPVLYQSIHLSLPRHVHSLTSTLTTNNPPSTLIPIPRSPIRSLALSFPPDPPSLRLSLASIAETGAFDRVKYLAIRADFLSTRSTFSSGWIEHMKPETVMLFDVRPMARRSGITVQWTSPVFERVETLYTCTIDSLFPPLYDLAPPLSPTPPQPLPSLRRLALTAHADWAETPVIQFCAYAACVLYVYPYLEVLCVRVVVPEHVSDAAEKAMREMWEECIGELCDDGCVEIAWRARGACDEWTSVITASAEDAWPAPPPALGALRPQRSRSESEWYLDLSPPLMPHAHPRAHAPRNDVARPRSSPLSHAVYLSDEEVGEYDPDYGVLWDSDSDYDDDEEGSGSQGSEESLSLEATLGLEDTVL